MGPPNWPVKPPPPPPAQAHMPCLLATGRNTSGTSYHLCHPIKSTCLLRYLQTPVILLKSVNDRHWKLRNRADAS